MSIDSTMAARAPRPSKAALQLAETQVKDAVRAAYPDLAAHEGKAVLFDPMWTKRMVDKVVSDPLWNAIHFKWRDTQQLGRLAYDAMLRHGAVSAPYKFLVACTKSCRGTFVPRTKDPTEKQRQFAAYANGEIQRLVLSEDPRQGWTRVMDWFAQGVRYGFSLAEHGAEYAVFDGAPRIRTSKIVPLPQATLDTGYVPLEEFGQSYLALASDVRYRCFEMDAYGGIDAYVQFNGFGDDKRITWRGGERKHILHYVHGGGEGSPYGESLLFSAFWHWSDLYTLELMESAMLDAGFPFLFITYKTPDGAPSPNLHKQVVDNITSQDPASRVLVVPNADAKSVAPSNADFTAHAEKKKKELRNYITTSMLVPASLYTETQDSQSDAKALMSVFFKRVLPSFLQEFADVMTGQFAKRLIDANWSKFNEEDYPVFQFNVVLDEDLRAATALLQQVFPYVDASRLGEFIAACAPGIFSADLVPQDHKDSVAVKRPVLKTQGAAGSPTGPASGEPASAPTGRAPGTSDTDGNV